MTNNKLKAKENNRRRIGYARISGLSSKDIEELLKRKDLPTADVEEDLFKGRSKRLIEYIPKFVSELDLDSYVEQLAIQFLQKKVSVFVMNGKNPGGYAAAAIYLVCIKENIKITQAELVKVSGLTDATIRTRIRQLQKFL